MRVAEYKFGNTRCIINDECLVYRTEEERREVFQRCSNIVYGALRRQQDHKRMVPDSSSGGSIET